MMTLTPNKSTESSERITLEVSDSDFRRYAATPKDRLTIVTVTDLVSGKDYSIRRGVPCGGGCACAAEIVESEEWPDVITA